MTKAPPRRLLLIASPPSDTRAPVRRYRLGRVLMGPEQLIDMPPRPADPDGARRAT